MSKKLLVTFAALTLVGSLAVPATAQAQWRVGIGFGFYGYPYGWYGPWGYGYAWAPYAYGPWGYPYGPYGYGYYGGGWSSLRIEAQPKQAEVYVDGAIAGVVDDFDSWYQSLNVHPGNHEIAIYAEGFRTLHRQMYFAPASAQHIKLALEKLGPGETTGPRPQPAPPPPDDLQVRPGQPYPYPQYAQGGGQPQDPRGRPEPPQQQPPQQPPPPQDAMARFGTLSLRIQPADAEVFVDGHSWTGAASDPRLSIRLSAGRHHVEVHKDGYDGYTEDVLIRPDATMTLNVGLVKR